MTISLLNDFCLKFDLVFIELGRVKSNEVYWFVDHTGSRYFYTFAEITSKLSQTPC